MTDDDAKDVAKAIEKIINRKKIHISVEKARNIVATIKMMEFVGYDLNTHDSDMYANPATCPIVCLPGQPIIYNGIYPRTMKQKKK